ncbi:MAG TPA: [protein-PII] uridylyltransferase [Pseudomonadales bacterium]|nr:[protein-PII] uridylyltransferase [Pseudomonadales bacterium]
MPLSLDEPTTNSGYQVPLDIFNAPLFRYQLAEDSHWVSCCRDKIAAVTQFLAAEFERGVDIVDLIQARAIFMDGLLSAAWTHTIGDPTPHLALIAVGGYGRGELHPSSDVDLLVLGADETTLEKHSAGLSTFITFLWDLKLEIGHSVRTIDECAKVASEDLTIVTTLVETRHIIGDPRQLEKLHEAVSIRKMWNSHDFFAAKRIEQRDRHRKYANTEFNLEPNIKTSPGGLRDVHLISWVARRHYGIQSLNELVTLGFMTADELAVIEDNVRYLWRVRFALHTLTGRHEDRLLFDHQRTLAKQFGYKDKPGSLAVEQFMKVYYRCAAAISAINELLTQHFEEAILRACESETILKLNQRFRIRNGYIEACNDRVFIETPSALLEVFVLLAQTPNIHGVRASTIRLIRQSAHLINDSFRRDPRNTALFVELLRAPYKITTQMRRMTRYGVLGNYIPAFGRIIGQMQHDLFHIYTVDAHTLQVIQNLRRFTYDDQMEQFPIACNIARRMQKPELLYIAGLFHDIAKGRGGDHSTLGAVDAYDFCIQHGFSNRDSKLVAWLVEMHLSMSSISQKQDLSDPEVIHAFATQVGDQLHLDYLYALTVADMNATNNTVWNTWRASLMRQLYSETRLALRRGLENVIDKSEWIEDTRQQALALLEEKGIRRERAIALMGDPGEDYFLRESAEDIAWQIDALDKHPSLDQPLILLKQYGKRAFEGATQLFVMAKDRRGLFADITNALELLGLDIQDAKIYNSTNHNAIDTFILLDEEGKPIGEDSGRLAHIKEIVLQALTHPENMNTVQRRTPRQLKHFAAPTRVKITTDITRNQSVIEVITPDRPGLLAAIGRVFNEFNVNIQNAKISTLGERVEDVFFITDEHLNPISDPDLCLQIQSTICERLDRRASE